MCWSEEVHPPATKYLFHCKSSCLLLFEIDSQNRNRTNSLSQQNIIAVKLHFVRVHKAGRGG